VHLTGLSPPHASLNGWAGRMWRFRPSPDWFRPLCRV